MNALIAIDWLQLFCIVPKNIYSRSKQLTVNLTATRTRHFSKVYSIVDNSTNEEIAVLAAEPHQGSVINNEFGILKIVNKYLYQANLKDFVKDILKDLNITFVSITRIDIAVDFLKFDNGMQCERFIKDYLVGQLIKAGRSTTWKTSGATPNQSENNEGKKISFCYLAFGKETSEVSYKLYNKSQEMRDVKEKNWIKDIWKINNYNEEQKQDVWRLEFSIKNRNKDREDKQKRIYNLKTLDLLDPENMVKIWQHMVEDKFSFYLNKGKHRKDRNEKVVLFESFNFKIVKSKVSKKKETGRSQKIFAKKLMELNQDLRGDDYALGIFSKDLFNFYIEQYDLQSWAKKKGYQLEPTTLPEWTPYALKQLELKEAKQSNDFINQINLFNQQHLYNNLPF